MTQINQSIRQQPYLTFYFFTDFGIKTLYHKNVHENNADMSAVYIQLANTKTSQ